MKKSLLITLVIFLFFTNPLKAQELEQECINKSSSYIRESMKDHGFVLTNTGKNPEGTKKYITFCSNSTNLTFYFDIDGDDCLGVISLVPKTFLPRIIQFLNKSYISNKDLTWMSFDNQFKITVNATTLPKELVIRYTTK